MGSPQILTGPGCVCYINGQVYGNVSSFSWDSETPNKRINGLDSNTPFELAPGETTVRFTINMYRLKGSGGAQGVGIAALPQEASRQRYFSLLIVDRENQVIIFRSDWCMTNSEKWDVSPRAFVTGSLSCEALDFSNEIEPVMQ
jgi:hypothetical protein